MVITSAVAMAGAGLLVVAGLAKLRTPVPAALALRAAGLPATVPAVRALAGVEVVVGVAVLSVAGRAAVVALALVYGAVTIVAWRQLRAGAGCGCFGSDATSVTWLHVSVNALIALAAAATGATTAPPALPPLVAAAPVAGLSTTAALALSVVLLRLALTLLPEVWAAQRLQPRQVAT